MDQTPGSIEYASVPETSERGRFDSYWKQFCFFRGWLQERDLARVRELALVCKDVEGERKFFLIKKELLKRTRAMRPTHSTSKCMELCPKHLQDGHCRSDCTKAHLACALMELPLVMPPADTNIFVHGRQVGTFAVNIANTEPTAGLLLAVRLMNDGTVGACQPWICEQFNKGNCRNGNKCLYVHVKKLTKESNINDLVEHSTPLPEALAHVIQTPGLTEFLDKDLSAMGIRNVGDVQMMSNSVFEAMSRQAEKKTQVFWMLLNQLRQFDEATPTMLAMIRFPGIEPGPDLLPKSLNTIKQLIELKPKQFYSLPLPARTLDVLERIRSRFDTTSDQPAYNSINLGELDPESFFPVMSRHVCDFRATKAHKSWRKQDATRPIVTSLITFVDPDTCTCKQQKDRNINIMNTPTLGITPSSMRIGGRESSTGGTASAAERDYPAGSWCTCKRNFEMAVNYELSTPSGSRCSEQNCLGRIASMGLPTDCIREVFVHGGSHEGQDPNPLFPCGVCENMFRRVSKDVMKNHSGDVMLYMFDSVDNPKKLVCIPICEISLRAGSSFKRFVAEDLREE